MSAFGKPFKDEFDSRLLHEARGVLSMANSGPETNKSQFFITFKSAKHLDNMHTVFGRVVGGLAVLGRIEAVGSEGDKKENAPSKDIIIEAMVVFDSPYAEADELLFQQVKARMASRIMAEEKIRETPASQVEKSKLLAKASAAARDVPTPSELTGKDKSGLGASGVGKYLRGLPKAEGSLEVDSAQFKFGECVEDERRLPKKAKSNASSGFSNFSAW